MNLPNGDVYAPAAAAGDGDDAELTPEDSLAVITAQQRLAQRRLELDPVHAYVPWGIAWLVGYGLFFLRFGPDERIFVSMPEWLPLAVLLTLLGLAGLVTGIAGARAYRGIAGESSERGVMYGLAWALATFGFIALAGRFESELSEPLAGLLWGTLPVLITATLFMSGGAVWRDRQQFGVGVWLVAVLVLALVLGPGWHSLVIAVLGGGGFLGAATVSAVRRQRGEAA